MSEQQTKEVFSLKTNGVSTNWSYNFYTFTEILNDTIPSYHIEYIPERFNEASLRRVN